MLFSEVFKYVPHLLPEPFKNRSFQDLKIDSRDIKKNDLFIATVGNTINSHKFIPEILKQGAWVIKNQDEPIELEPELLDRVISVSNTSDIIALLSKAFFQDPDEHITIIGVTGTNGKTSTTSIIHHLLEKHGWKTGLIGTIQNKIGNTLIPTKNTTPDAFHLYSLLSSMQKQGCKTVSMEISSHALALKRVAGLSLDVVIFTNLTPEHLDFHSNMEDYLQTKLSIFTLLKESTKKNKLAIYNNRIPVVDSISNKVKELELPFCTFSVYSSKEKPSTKDFSQDFTAQITQSNIQGTSFDLYKEGTKLLTNIETPLQGAFNIENLLGALVCLDFLNISLVWALLEAKDVHIQGRFQNISVGYPYSIIIDYAHSPDALENILKTARSLNPHKIIVIFGCGGDRDKTKRPVMGHIASHLADITIITSDNPRTEDPFQIIAEIKENISAQKTLLTQVNRKQAIKKGFELLENGDIMIIAGKGHEEYQIFKYKTIPFSDQQIIDNLLKGK